MLNIANQEMPIEMVKIIHNTIQHRTCSCTTNDRIVLFDEKNNVVYTVSVHSNCVKNMAEIGSSFRPESESKQQYRAVFAQTPETEAEPKTKCTAWERLSTETETIWMFYRPKFANNVPVNRRSQTTHFLLNSVSVSV